MKNLKNFEFPKGVLKDVATKCDVSYNTVLRTKRGQHFNIKVIEELVNAAEHCREVQARAEKIFG